MHTVKISSHGDVNALLPFSPPTPSKVAARRLGPGFSGGFSLAADLFAVVDAVWISMTVNPHLLNNATVTADMDSTTLHMINTENIESFLKFVPFP